MPDADALAATIPGLEAEYDAERATLRLEFDPGVLSTSELNAQVLPAVLEQGCGVPEVRRGGGLEQEYLKKS